MLIIFFVQIMSKKGLLKHFYLAIERVNSRLVEEFETGEPAGVARRVGEYLVPAINILQDRTNKDHKQDALLLEEVTHSTNII